MICLLISEILSANACTSMDTTRDTNSFSYPDEKYYERMAYLFRDDAPHDPSDSDSNDAPNYPLDSDSEMCFKGEMDSKACFEEMDVNDAPFQIGSLHTVPNHKTYLKEIQLVPSNIKAKIENEKNKYLNWNDFDHIFPERNYWVNKNFIELLSLTMNIKANKTNSYDLSRHKEICDLIVSSDLPANCAVVQYTKYLSYENWSAFGSLGRYFSLKPDLKQYLNKPNHDNEKALYLFDTYLNIENPNHKNLFLDPITIGLRGAMADFVRTEYTLYPIRSKSIETWSLDEAVIMLTCDHGLVHQNLIDMLEIITFHSHQDKKYELFKEMFAEKLSRISTVYKLKGVPKKLKVSFFVFCENADLRMNCLSMS